MGELGFCLHLVEKMQLYIISLITHKHEQFHKEGVDSREKDLGRKTLLLEEVREG